MEIGVYIRGAYAHAYRLSDGHDLHVIGNRGAKTAVSNGAIIAILDADGHVYRYNAKTGHSLGVVGPKDPLTIAITRACLFVFLSNRTRYFDPATGHKKSQAGSEFATTAETAKPKRATAIRKIQKLAKLK
jgi:hypothetical protein